jgi:hypothetical protein
MFIWGRCSNGRMGFSPSATVELPHEIQLPGGAERWHPICVAAGGRHSMCMALPRHTVTDHERRLTNMSDSESMFGDRASLGDFFGTTSPNMPIRTSRTPRHNALCSLCSTFCMFYRAWCRHCCAQAKSHMVVQLHAHVIPH